MDYLFMRMKSAPNVQAISTCVVVKEDRHQNIMSSVALKKEVKEPWTIERVVRFSRVTQSPQLSRLGIV